MAGAGGTAESWSPQDVADYIRGLTGDFGDKAGEYAENMAKEDINGKAFLNLTADELKELGLSMGHRKLLLQRAALLNNLGASGDRAVCEDRAQE